MSLSAGKVLVQLSSSPPLQSQKLEMVQRQALVVILGKDSKSYASNLTKLEIPLLAERRLELTKRFAIQTLLNPRHSSDCFTPNQKYGVVSWTTRHPRLLIPKQVLCVLMVLHSPTWQT